jgi:hypothetical protein
MAAFSATVMDRCLPAPGPAVRGLDAGQLCRARRCRFRRRRRVVLGPPSRAVERLRGRRP